MKRMTRILAGLLVLLLLLPALGGCFGNKKKLPEKQKVDHVYRYDQQVIVEKGEGNSYIGSYQANENAYAYVFIENNDDYTERKTVLHIGDYTTDHEILLFHYVEDDSADRTEYAYCNGIALLEDAVLADIYTSTYDRKTDTYSSVSALRVYGLDGSDRGTIDLKKLLDTEEELSGGNLYCAGNTVYLQVYNREMYDFDLIGFTPDGEIVGQYSFLPEDGDGYISKVFAAGDMLVAAVETYGADTYGCQFVRVSQKTGEKIDTIEIDSNIFWNAFTDADGNVYSADSYALYQYDPVTKSKTELMNFLNSDYIYDYGKFECLPDGRFCQISQSYSDSKTTLSRTVFSPVPEEEVQAKYLITVASAGYAYNFQEQIVKFNLASDEYRMCYKDYTQYNTDDDRTLAATMLNQDLLKGDIPDILIADDAFNISRYINKGIFADLNTFLNQADSTLRRADFLDNVLSACEIDGKLYAIPTNIYLLGLMGKKDLLDEYRGLTVRQFVDRVKALPEGVSFFRDGDSSREDVLQQLFFINYVNFYDAKTGRCSLTNDDFKAILEFVSTMPEKSMWDDMDYDNFDWQAYENLFRDGKAIACLNSMSDFRAFEYNAYQFGNEEVDFIGFPAPDGDGLVFASSNLSFLISANSPFADQAWNFIKIFYEDDYQINQGWGFPVIRSALEKKKQSALDDLKKQQENGEEPDGAVSTEMMIASSTVMAYDVDASYDHQLTEEDIEHVYELVLAVRKQLVYDQDIFDIIKEEASAYFAGKKSIDEVASLAENRVNIKLSEAR